LSTVKAKKHFTTTLLAWHRQENDRTLPWKGEKDPYKIWLSEIILQQTRAEQGLPYYEKFISTYPTVFDLAKAPEEEVFRLWQGLGYYNRCRNLLAAARQVIDTWNGKFPADYGSLLSLKGVGNYTSAAIASFAFGLNHAVVDGNVTRVLSRYFGIEDEINSTKGKEKFQGLATELLGDENSADFNQGIMDFGAAVCKPANPVCDSCPLSRHCFALKHDLTAVLPVKAKKPAVKRRYFHYLLVTREGSLWIRKREEKDIWHSLYEPMLIESQAPLTMNSIKKTLSDRQLSNSLVEEAGETYSQRLTHQLIESKFYKIELTEAEKPGFTGGQWVKFNDLSKYPFPKTLLSFLEKKFYF
jgi:A/G-specific adenine glycosylase